MPWALCISLFATHDSSGEVLCWLHYWVVFFLWATHIFASIILCFISHFCFSNYILKTLQISELSIASFSICWSLCPVEDIFVKVKIAKIFLLSFLLKCVCLCVCALVWRSSCIMWGKGGNLQVLQRLWSYFNTSAKTELLWRFCQSQIEPSRLVPRVWPVTPTLSTLWSHLTVASLKPYRFYKYVAVIPWLVLKSSSAV